MSGYYRGVDFTRLCIPKIPRNGHIIKKFSPVLGFDTVSHLVHSILNCTKFLTTRHKYWFVENNIYLQ